MACLAGEAPRPGSALTDARGAVYVEFLFAFMPVFLLFLATTQLSLLTAARLVVKHAAWSGVRSAVVTLHDDPDAFDGAPCGNLTEGEAETVPNADDLLSALRLAGAGRQGVREPEEGTEGGTKDQRGARMVPIRSSAYFPLLGFAPDASVFDGEPAEDVASSLTSELGRHAAAALDYTRAAAVVSVHASPNTEELAEQFGKQAPVTVRVTYLVYCGVPLAGALVCDTLNDLVGRDEADGDSGSRLAVLRRRFENVESRSGFERLAASGARFAVFEGEATLPNQGAEYEPPEQD